MLPPLLMNTTNTQVNPVDHFSYNDLQYIDGLGWRLALWDSGCNTTALNSDEMLDHVVHRSSYGIGVGGSVNITGAGVLNALIAQLPYINGDVNLYHLDSCSRISIEGLSAVIMPTLQSKNLISDRQLQHNGWNTSTTPEGRRYLFHRDTGDILHMIDRDNLYWLLIRKVDPVLSDAVQCNILAQAQSMAFAESSAYDRSYPLIDSDNNYVQRYGTDAIPSDVFSL